MTRKQHSTYNLRVTAAADPAGDELQSFLLDSSHALDEWLFSHILTTAGNRARDILTHHFVHVQHVQVDTTQLHTHIHQYQDMPRQTALDSQVLQVVVFVHLCVCFFHSTDL